MESINRDEQLQRYARDLACEISCRVERYAPDERQQLHRKLLEVVNREIRKGS